MYLPRIISLVFFSLYVTCKYQFATFHTSIYIYNHTIGDYRKSRVVGGLTILWKLIIIVSSTLRNLDRILLNRHAVYIYIYIGTFKNEVYPPVGLQSGAFFALLTQLKRKKGERIHPLILVPGENHTGNRCWRRTMPIDSRVTDL